MNILKAVLSTICIKLHLKNMLNINVYNETETKSRYKKAFFKFSQGWLIWLVQFETKILCETKKYYNEKSSMSQLERVDVGPHLDSGLPCFRRLNKSTLKYLCWKFRFRKSKPKDTHS